MQGFIKEVAKDFEKVMHFKFKAKTVYGTVVYIMVNGFPLPIHFIC